MYSKLLFCESQSLIWYQSHLLEFNNFFFFLVLFAFFFTVFSSCFVFFFFVFFLPVCYSPGVVGLGPIPMAGGWWGHHYNSWDAVAINLINAVVVVNRYGYCGNFPLVGDWFRAVSVSVWWLENSVWLFGRVPYVMVVSFVVVFPCVVAIMVVSSCFPVECFVVWLCLMVSEKRQTDLWWLTTVSVCCRWRICGGFGRERWCLV